MNGELGHSPRQRPRPWPLSVTRLQRSFGAKTEESGGLDPGTHAGVKWLFALNKPRAFSDFRLLVCTKRGAEERMPSVQDPVAAGQERRFLGVTACRVRCGLRTELCAQWSQGSQQGRTPASSPCQ